MDEDKDSASSAAQDQAVAQFKTALRRLTTYGGDSRNGEPTRKTQVSLSEHANVKRSTLSTYMTPADSTHGRNPGLDKLCRLAEALGLPPALLLMTSDDWSRLLAGVQTYIDVMSGSGGDRLMEFERRTVGSPQYRGHSRELVRDATEMAVMMFGRGPATEHASSIAASSLAMPLSQLDPSVRGLAMAIAVHFGTSAIKSKFMGEQVQQESTNGAG
jgi:hypothetical protein